MDELHRIEWEISVSIFRHPVIAKQLAIAIGVPFGILLIVLIIVKAYNGIILVGCLLLFTWLFIRLIWSGKYHMGFMLNKTGVRSYTLKKQAKKNRTVNVVTIVAGLLTGSPIVTGTGMLAASRQDIFVRWCDVKRVKFLPIRYTILIKSGFSQQTTLFCHPENYSRIEAYIKTFLPDIVVNADITKPW